MAPLRTVLSNVLAMLAIMADPFLSRQRPLRRPVACRTPQGGSSVKGEGPNAERLSFPAGESFASP
jgi:hypothetical protein